MNENYMKLVYPSLIMGMMIILCSKSNMTQFAFNIFIGPINYRVKFNILVSVFDIHLFNYT